MYQFFGDGFGAAVLQRGCYIQEFESGVAAIFLVKDDIHRKSDLTSF
jgi:hypothetical protein